ncbi:spore germination protein GerPE [Virgibacillus senegalensis]|uniref:spore germination protein GerPE n=1 Tax=Virgibacillus senegalensis TaxID=1499679 RepID=UPI00069E5022|nr:spore germination protein GerPE [Virgibacillus senegalensis]
MMKRTSYVDTVYVNAVSRSSILEVGDVNSLRPESMVLAVQQEGIAETGEVQVEFSDFPVFSKPPASLPSAPPVSQTTIHHCPGIGVGNIRVLGVAASSTVQVGSLNVLDSEARLKHIRIIREEQNDSSSNTM